MEKNWQDMKNLILGRKFDLSIVWGDGKLMRQLNADYRKKSYEANVLSFPLSESEGEIFINESFNSRRKEDDADFLILHSLLHLAGFKHGKKMEAEEKKLKAKFNIKPKTF